jgi:hypothetical protein
MKLISVFSLGFALVSTFPGATALPLSIFQGSDKVKPIWPGWNPSRCGYKGAPCTPVKPVRPVNPFNPAIFWRDDKLAVAARAPQDEALETALENLILENIESRDISVAARDVEDLEMREPIPPGVVDAAVALAPYAIDAAPHVVSAVKKWFKKLFRREDNVDELIADWVANELASRSLPVLSARADEDSDADALVNNLVRALQIVARGFEI